MAGSVGGGRVRGRLGQDDRLAVRALREDWPVPAEKRQVLIGRLLEIATSPDSRPRDATAAARALLEASRISLESVRVAAYATRPPAAGPVAISVTGPALSPELAAAICAVTDGGGGSGPVPPRLGLPSPPPADAELEDGLASDPEPPPPPGADEGRAAAVVTLAREGGTLTDAQQRAVLELLCDEDDPFPAGPAVG